MRVGEAVFQNKNSKVPNISLPDPISQCQILARGEASLLRQFAELPSFWPYSSFHFAEREPYVRVRVVKGSFALRDEWVGIYLECPKLSHLGIYFKKWLICHVMMWLISHG